ncbi:MAG: VOC family protein [Dehalococcoidia bacterium]
MLRDAPLMPLVGVADLDRARAFYGDVLGLPVLDEDGFAVSVGCGGSTLRITRVEEPVAAVYSVLAWRVPDIAAAVDGLAAAGVEFLRYPGMDQDARGVWTAPGGAKVAWFHDPDRNNLSLVQMPA